MSGNLPEELRTDLDELENQQVVDTSTNITDWASRKDYQDSFDLRNHLSFRNLAVTINTNKGFFKMSTEQQERYREFFALLFGNKLQFILEFIVLFPYQEVNGKMKVDVDDRENTLALEREDIYYAEMTSLPELTGIRNGERLHYHLAIQLVHTRVEGYISMFDSRLFHNLFLRAWKTQPRIFPTGSFNKSLYAKWYVRKAQIKHLFTED